MKIGKVPEEVLKQCVFSQLNTSRKEVLVPPGVGEDCSVLELSEGEVFVVSTDPITGTQNNIGRLSVHITANDIASSGATVIGLMLTLLLPDGFSEEELNFLMKEISDECDSLGIVVLGGHTEVSAAVNQPIVSVTGIGKVKKEKLIKTGGAKPDEDLVMTKYAAIEGTAIIAYDKGDRLNKYLSTEQIEKAKDLYSSLSVLKEAEIASSFGVSSMHDVTEGGVFGAVWEVCESSNVGAVIEKEKIPVLEETKIICENMKLNPYKLISSGSMLITAKNGEKLVELLKQNGINAAVIGHTTEKTECFVDSFGTMEKLFSPGTDELYNA